MYILYICSSFYHIYISVSICPLNTVYDTVSSNFILTNLNFILCQCTRRDWTNVKVVHELLASLPQNMNWLLQVLAWQINLPATLTLCSLESLHVMLKVVLVVSVTSYRHSLDGEILLLLMIWLEEGFIMSTSTVL